MRTFVALGAVFALAAPSLAQAADPGGREVRLGLGAQAVPSYPGSDAHDILPLPLFDMRSDGEEYVYEAPDESFGFTLFSPGGVEVGPTLNIQSAREDEDVGAPVGKVSTTIEAGAFIQAYLNPKLRVRLEGRRGIGGHEGWVGAVAADYVLRDGDNYVFSLGPRLRFSDENYQSAYFGVSQAASAASGLARHDPDGGLHAVGATAGFQYQLNQRWGLYSYAQYDRLIGDAADSPIVDRFGSKNQFSGGVALTYSFRWSGS